MREPGGHSLAEVPVIVAKPASWKGEHLMRSVESSVTEFGIASIFEAVLRRKVLIVSLITGSVLLGVAALVLVHPRYTATMEILLDPKGPSASDTGGDFVSSPVDSVKVGSVVSVIQSNQLLDRVVRAENLTKDPDFCPSIGVVGRVLNVVTGKMPDPVDTSEQAKIAAASEILHKMMTVTRDGFTYVVRIDVVAKKAEKARRLAQAIGDAYLNDKLEAKYESARRNFNWLSEHLDEMKSELMTSEDSVQKLRHTYGFIQTEQGAVSTLALQETTELNKQLIIAQADSSQKQARADLATSLQRSGADLESLPEVATSVMLLQLKQRKAQATSKLAEVSQHYGARHPEAIRAENDLRMAQADVAGEAQRVVAALQNDAKAAAFRVTSLQAEMTKLADVDGKTTDGLSRLHQAQRVAEANRRLYDSFLNRFKDVEHRQTVDDLEARIISPPRLPTEASFPRPAPFLLAALGFGVFIAFAAAFARECMERTFTTPAQVEQMLGMHVLASVPLLKSLELIEGGGKRLSLMDYTAKNPVSRYADSLRGIRLALEGGMHERARIVSFTSSMPNEGKSTLAACVATSAALAGAKTILIDCDLRNPTTSTAFGCRGRQGIADVLSGSAVLEDILVQTARSSLLIIPAGNCGHRPPDLVNSQRLRQLILSAAEIADFVVIDSAAIEQVPDAIVPSQIADETIMVVKWRGSDRAVTSRAIDQLQRAHAKVTGIVLNSVDLKEASRYGYWTKTYLRQTSYAPRLRA